MLRRKYMSFARRTTYEVLRELTDDERLIGVLTGQYGDYGLPPRQSSFAMHATLVKHYFGGGAYPVGGSARIAETFVPRIEALGGAVGYSTRSAGCSATSARPALARRTSSPSCGRPWPTRVCTSA